MVGPSDVRQASRSEVLWVLLGQGVASRDHLATATGLSASTVSRVIDDLVQDGFVRERPSVPTGRRGRRITPIEFVGNVGAVVGVDLGGTNCRMIAVDLLGKVMQQFREETPNKLSGPRLARWLADRVDTLVDGAPLYSVTVGLPGIVHPLTGSVRAADNLPQVDGNGFVDELRKRLASPVSFDNDSNLALLGEMRLGGAQKYNVAVMFTIGTGLGAGVFLDGHLLRGRTGLVGEFGCYLPVGLDGETLQEVLSASGLLKEAARLGTPLESPIPLFSRRPPKELVAVRRRFERALFFALVGMTTAYDPEVIVLGGGVAPSLKNILPKLQKRLEALIPECPAVVLSKLGDPAGAIGALVVGLQEAYAQIGVDPGVLDSSVGPRLVELVQSPSAGVESPSVRSPAGGERTSPVQSTPARNHPARLSRKSPGRSSPDQYASPQ